MKNTQKQKIHEYMAKHGSITPIEAMNNIGCFRLAARIADLRHDGVQIKRRMIAVKNREGETVTVAQYSLMEVK